MDLGRRAVGPAPALLGVEPVAGAGRRTPPGRPTPRSTRCWRRRAGSPRRRRTTAAMAMGTSAVPATRTTAAGGVDDVGGRPRVGPGCTRARRRCPTGRRRWRWPPTTRWPTSAGRPCRPGRRWPPTTGRSPATRRGCGASRAGSRDRRAGGRAAASMPMDAAAAASQARDRPCMPTARTASTAWFTARTPNVNFTRPCVARSRNRGASGPRRRASPVTPSRARSGDRRGPDGPLTIGRADPRSCERPRPPCCSRPTRRRAGRARCAAPTPARPCRRRRPDPTPVATCARACA